jgi:multiple sugar transport system permease protein
MLRRLVLASLIAWSLAPVAWLFVTSLKPDTEIIRLPPVLPEQPTLDHYRTVFTGRPFGRILANSAGIALAVTVATLALAAPAAFALVKLRMAGARVLLALILAASMFPQIATVAPLYLLIRAAGMRDTWAGVAMAHMALALPAALWVLVQSMRELPDELVEAAALDGCTALEMLRHVVLPLVGPGLATAGILVFISSWNEFLFALSFTATENARTVPVEIALFPGLHQVPWGDIAAAACTVTLPVVLLVLIFQRRIVSGLAAGATKG